MLNEVLTVEDENNTETWSSYKIIGATFTILCWSSLVWEMRSLPDFSFVFAAFLILPTALVVYLLLFVFFAWAMILTRK